MLCTEGTEKTLTMEAKKNLTSLSAPLQNLGKKDYQRISPYVPVPTLGFCHTTSAGMHCNALESRRERLRLADWARADRIRVVLEPGPTAHAKTSSLGNGPTKGGFELVSCRIYRYVQISCIRSYMCLCIYIYMYI